MNINGDLILAGNLLPTETNKYNLGNSDHRWLQTQTKYLSVGAGDISSSGYEAVISGDLHITGYSLFDDYVQIGGARDSSAYKFYVNGKTHLKGDTRITGNLLMTTGGSSIYWDDGTCRQRIINTDDSTANTAVFNFQQSENSGSSWKNLLEIRDNGRLVLTNKTGGIYRVDDGATNEPLIHLSNNNVDSSIMRIDGNGRSSVVNTQSHGFDLKYIGTGEGENNSLDLIADNMDGANVTAISVSNNGKIGIGDKFNTNYRLYVNGNSYLKGNNFLYGDLSAFYDGVDQYLQYTAEGTVASHAAKISLYRIIASGKAGTAGTKVPGVQLDAATGMLHLQAAASDPSASAGARIKFTYWNAASDNGQPVYISHSVNDSYRAPYGLKIWGSDGSAPGAWLEVEGNLYIGSASNSNSNDNAALYIRGMSAIEGYDTWLRLNDNSSFSSGTLSPKLIRSDEALQVGSGGANFYANSSGNGYIQNTFGVHGTDTTKHFFVNGTSRFADDITMDNGSEILFSTNTQYLRWTTDTSNNNSTGRSWYGIGTYQNTSDSNNSWLNISNYLGINITTKGTTYFRHNNNVITTTGNQTGTVGSGTHPIYSSGGVLMASSSTVGSGVRGIYLNAGAITPMSYELKATVNAGTANRIAYYSGTTAISSGNNIWTNGTKLQINEISAEKNYNFYVNGTSYFNGNIQIVGTTTARNINPETDNTYSLGTNSYRWKDLSLARSIKSNSRYYPIVGNAYGSAWYKVTFPWAGQTRDSNAWFMTSMDLVIGGPYSGGTSGTIHLAYYFFYTGSNHTYGAANVYGSAIGTRLGNVIIKYDLANPGIMYVKASSNQYCGLAINNLMVHDSAPSYDFTNTTIQTIAEADVPTTANKTVPLTLFGSNDGGNTGLAYVLKSGDTMTGDLTAPNISVNQYLKVNAYSGYGTGWGGLWYDGNNKKLWAYSNAGNDAVFQASKVYGAVWNDYAEYRITNKVKPGQCVVETGLGDLIQSTKRLQPGANIVSDTFGFAIGETEKTKTPLAVSGRALAYPYEDRYSYSAGDPVCSGPNGTISKMTREEVCKYPDRIVGTVSEIPEYETWGTGNVKVDGRIWIKVR